MTLAESVTAGAEVEESTILLGTASSREGDRHQSITVGDRVRRRLALCLFLHIIGVAIVTQVYPRVVLDHFHDDDGKASKFNGWLTLVSSIVQLIAVPTLCGASDVVGRRAILGGSLALTSVSTLCLGLAPNSIVAVSACQLVSGVAGAILPVSQAVIVDLSHWSEAAGGGEVTHGIGLIGAAFGLAISVGPVLGGSLSVDHRSTACILSSSMSLVSVLSLAFYGWKETAPPPQAAAAEAAAAEAAARNASSREREGSGIDIKTFYAKGSEWRMVNPFSVLKIFLESSLLMQMAGVLVCFCFSLNVFIVYYNYFDFRYNWSALDISFFFSTFGVTLALTSGVIIRFLVPNRLSMEHGVVLGMLLQAVSTLLYGVVPCGWMLYPVLLLTVLQYITEPCIQGVMATLVGADRQGSLQGAVQSLRILAAGIAGAGYGQIFSLGVSDAMKDAVGFYLPGLPLYCSAGFALCGLGVAWFALRKLGVGAKKTADSSLDAAERGRVGGVGPIATATVPMMSQAEGNGGAEGGSDRAIAAGKAPSAERTAPDDSTELGLAAASANRLEGEGEKVVNTARGLRSTGLGDEEDTMSGMSEPLLPRSGSSGGRNGNESLPS